MLLTSSIQPGASVGDVIGTKEVVHVFSDGVYGFAAIKSDDCVSAPLAIQNVNINGPLLFDASTRIDSRWTHVAATNEFSYSGQPNRVRIVVLSAHEIPGNVNSQRPAPVLSLFRNGTLVSRAATGYIRDTSDHEESSNLISLLDVSPGTDPVYTIEASRDSTITGTVDSVVGYFSAEAVR